MEKSYNYRRRKELMAKLQVPTIGETKRELGEGMADILFLQCPRPLKPEYGLVPTLDGPGDELWVSPSDLLIPKVCLKPPLTTKYIRALTHEGILAIGESIDRRYWCQMEEEKRRALEEQRALIMRIAEMERKVAIKLARQEERQLAAAHVAHLMEEFEKRLVEELNNLEEYMLSMQEKVVREAIEECDRGWKEKLQQSVNETIQQMTAERTKGIEEERKELEKQFRMELEKQNVEFNYALRREQEFCEITLRQLRHCLECKNLANLMYVLCMERRKCSIERCATEYIYKNKISELQKQICRKDADVQRLIDEKNKKQKQLDIREECLLELLKQFQKFINFALRAVPTQAEFLLSVEKMLLYEVAKETWQQGKRAIKQVCKMIMPWKSDSIITKSSAKYNLEPKDYHNCLEEADPRRGRGGESDVLPYFYYKDKMYVRRDMQYYFEHGIEISESNLLWNKDVENLMKILKATTEQKYEEEEGEEESSGCEDTVKEDFEIEDFTEKEDIPSLLSKQQLKDSKTSKHSEGSRKSSVSFPQKGDKSDPQAMLKSVLKDGVPPLSISSTSPQQYEVMDNIGLLAAQDSLATIRLSRRSSLKDAHSASEIETNQTLAAVKETLQEPGSKKNSLTDGGTVSFEHFQAIRILDEIELTKPSNRSSKISLGTKVKSALKSDRDSILQKPPRSPRPASNSKLLQATDSLIIHRNSLTAGSHKLQDFLATMAKQQPTPGTHVSHGSLISKLSFTKDSLELIRRQSLHSKKDPSAEEVILLSKSSSKQVADEEKFLQVKKVVSPLTVSHIEVAKIPTDIKEGDVRFSPIHEVYETNLLKTSDSPWNIYKDTGKPEVICPSEAGLPRQPQRVQIVGERKSKEYLESSSQFTSRRISSIMKILKKDPSLLRLFTSVKSS